MIEIKDRVLEDMALVEKVMKKDGDVPAVLFFHFKKTPKKIAKLMNLIDEGSLDVKEGFFFALTDHTVMENRHEFLSHLGTSFAALTHLGVLDKPDQLVFVSEAYASNDKTKRPSRDPKAKDVFVSAGLTKEGESHIEMKEKIMKMVKKGNQATIKIELIDMNHDVFEKGKGESPLLSGFFESYNTAFEKMEGDDTLKKFKEIADEDPLHAFRQGIDAAITLTKLEAFTR